MDTETTKRKMHRMRVLFYSFVVLIPVGLLLALGTSHQWIGVALFLVGGAAGTVCAFATCPCCSQLSGVFAKGFLVGAFPLGFCVHCRKSYLGAKGCEYDS